MKKSGYYSRYLAENRCPTCNGTGKLFDEADRDCVEGFKMADRKITCHACCGDGKFHVPAYMYDFTREYEQVMQERADMTEINMLISHLEELGFTNKHMDLLEAYFEYRDRRD